MKRKPIKQEDLMGCAVACVAFVMGKSYKETLRFFRNGNKRVKASKDFYCSELTSILNDQGFNYEYKYVKTHLERKIYKNLTIVFLKKSKKYSAGHYLCRWGTKWMDPWINHPDLNIKTGFRSRLYEKPSYMIFPK